METSFDSYWLKLNRAANDRQVINRVTRMMLAAAPACKPFCPIGYKMTGTFEVANHDIWIADPSQVPAHCKKMCNGNQVWDTNEVTPYDGVIGSCIDCAVGYKPDPATVDSCIPFCDAGFSLRMVEDLVTGNSQCECVSDNDLGNPNGENPGYIPNPMMHGDDLEIEDYHNKIFDNTKSLDDDEAWIQICGPRHLRLWKKNDVLRCIEVCPRDMRLNSHYNPQATDSGCGNPVVGSPICLPHCNLAGYNHSGHNDASLPECGPANMCPLGELPVFDSDGDLSNCESVCPTGGMVPNPWFTHFKQEQMDDMTSCQIKQPPFGGRWERCGSASGAERCQSGYGLECRGSMCVDPKNSSSWSLEDFHDPSGDSLSSEECTERKPIRYNQSCLNKIVDDTQPANYLDFSTKNYLFCGRWSKGYYGTCPKNKPICVDLNT
jgi:hypothetical protein